MKRWHFFETIGGGGGECISRREPFVFLSVKEGGYFHPFHKHIRWRSLGHEEFDNASSSSPVFLPLCVCMWCEICWWQIWQRALSQTRCHDDHLDRHYGGVTSASAVATSRFIRETNFEHAGASSVDWLIKTRYLFGPPSWLISGLHRVFSIILLPFYL